MILKKFGNMDISVSALGLGTVELGMDYGIAMPDERGKPESDDALNILHHACQNGINFFDTAPSYGHSERIVGEAFENFSFEKPVIATKINIPSGECNIREYVKCSIENSCLNLSTECLDIVQIHNATSDTFNDSAFLSALLEMRDSGIINYLGASVYDPENAIAVIDSKEVDLIQVAYNVIDQRMADDVLPEAHRKGIGIVCRSVYFKGLLTERAQYLPDSCSFLRDIAYRIKEELNFSSWSELSVYALRFALSNPYIDCVLVGVKNMQELQFALDIWKGMDCLSYEELELAKSCRVDDEFWLNPSNWGID